MSGMSAINIGWGQSMPLHLSLQLLQKSRVGSEGEDG